MTEGETARLTADIVLFATVRGQPHVLLIRRGWEPYEGCWAFPGGHVDAGEAVESAAHRELAEETGVHAHHLELVGVYGAPGRDPRGRYVTWAYTAVLPAPVEPRAGDDATEARWVPVAAALDNGLAFDHAQILRDATSRGVRADLAAADAEAARALRRHLAAALRRAANAVPRR